MKATIILPTFNAADTIAVQMDALAKQNWKDDYEFILADNGSTDNTVDIVISYSNQIPNLRILNVYNGIGPRNPVAVSYTKAFQAAHSDIFITCEGDDEAGENWLETMVSAMETAHFAGSAIDDFKLNDFDLVNVPYHMQTAETGFPTFVGPMKMPFSIGCCIGISRHLWETIGDPDPDLGVTWDVDYSWRAQLAGFELTFVPEVTMHYRMRTTFAGRYKQGLNYGRSSALLTAKYGVRSQLRFIAFNLYTLVTCGFSLLLSFLPFGSTPRYKVWFFANAMGQLQGFGHVRRGRQGTIKTLEELQTNFS